MRVTIFGSGYVGLVTGTCLADVGNDVLCIDVDPRKIELLQQGNVPIHEPGLEELVKRNLESGRLRFSLDIAAGVEHGEIQCIAVGTPPDEDGSADLQYVLQVADTIGKYMNSYKLVMDKSTVPVGTADKVRQTVQAALDRRGVTHEFDVVSNPEFLKEGAAIDDFMKPDRIVVGIEANRNCPEELMRELYAPFNRNHDRLIIMDVRSAELTKYAANAMLATKISFMNEIATIAEYVGADIEQVRIGIGSDPRIGFHFIYPGIGYGGSCFPKDVQALKRTAQQLGIVPNILEAVEAVNYQQRALFFNKIQKHFDNNLQGLRFALWGLTFKPNTDDMRDAPSRSLMESLWQHGAMVQAYDPKGMQETARIYGKRNDLILCDKAEATLQDADALIIATEWRGFRSPNFTLVKQMLKFPVIFDGRNIYDPQRMKKLGFTYYAIGRGDSLHC